MNTKNQFGKKGWTPDRIGSLKGKTFVITGTTSGTGFEAARILLSKGAKVVMLNRNSEKAEETIKALKQALGVAIDVINIRMDLGEQASVKKAAAEVLKNVTRIDALMCNGAIAQVPTQKNHCGRMGKPDGRELFRTFYVARLCCFQ